jgi:hypothetical protein
MFAYHPYPDQPFYAYWPKQTQPGYTPQKPVIETGPPKPEEVIDMDWLGDSKVMVRFAKGLPAERKNLIGKFLLANPDFKLALSFLD